MKFGSNWPSALGGDANCVQTTDDGRRTMDSWPIKIAQLPQVS